MILPHSVAVKSRFCSIVLIALTVCWQYPTRHRIVPETNHASVAIEVDGQHPSVDRNTIGRLCKLIHSSHQGLSL